tara:strand:- start:3307 stop:3414 length:108 start_codon:yes stop_codon:yes gene_type:complete
MNINPNNILGEICGKLSVLVGAGFVAWVFYLAVIA